MGSARTGKKNGISPAMLRPLLESHVPADLAEAVAGYLRTDYTAERMIRYLQRSEEAGIPLSPEDIVDEMLGILENRRNYYWRQGNRERMLRELLEDEEDGEDL